MRFPLALFAIGAVLTGGAHAQDPRDVESLATCMVERSDQATREAVRDYLVAALEGDAPAFTAAEREMSAAMIAAAGRCGITGEGFQQPHVNKALEQYGERIAEAVVTDAVTAMMAPESE